VVLDQRLTDLAEDQPRDLGADLGLLDEVVLVQASLLEGVGIEVGHPDLVALRLATSLLVLPVRRRHVLSELTRTADVVLVGRRLLAVVVLIHRPGVISLLGFSSRLGNFFTVPGGSLTHDETTPSYPQRGYKEIHDPRP